MQRGELFILSAPSGTGKTTLVQSLLRGDLGKFAGIAFAVSHTTRRPRQSEVNGRDYHFVSHGEFQRMIAEHGFLEWAEVHNNYYGTSLSEVLPRLDSGIDMLLDIDVQGFERIMARLRSADPTLYDTQAHSIFIMPPSYGDLKARLHQRNLDSPAEIARRLSVSQWEMERAGQYDYAIINDDAVRASQALASIILEKRHRRERMRERISEVLADFARVQQGNTPEGNP